MAGKTDAPVKKAPRQKPKEEEMKTDGWLTTYCDMVTLLFAFFVLLFALSQVDNGRFDVFVFAISNRDATAEEIMQFGQELGLFTEDAFDPYEPIVLIPIPADMLDAYRQITEAIEAAGMAEMVQAYLGDDFIFIRFLDEMLFAPDSAVIQSQNLDLLNLIGSSLRMVENDVGIIRIDGHTATIPGQQWFAVNDRELSGERATAVLRHFEDNIGIRGDRLAAMAFGRNRPIASNDTEEERRLNRRIEIMVTQADVVGMQLDTIYDRMIEREFAAAG